MPFSFSSACPPLPQKASMAPASLALSSKLLAGLNTLFSLLWRCKCSANISGVSVFTADEVRNSARARPEKKGESPL